MNEREEKMKNDEMIKSIVNDLKYETKRYLDDIEIINDSNITDIILEVIIDLGKTLEKYYNLKIKLSTKNVDKNL